MALLRVVTQLLVVISYRRCGTTNRSRLQGSRIQTESLFSQYRFYIEKGVGVEYIWFIRNVTFAV